MISERKIFFDEIGEILLRKKKGVKRLTIRINNEGSVHVTIPYLVSFKYAEKFVVQKKSWILKTKTKIDENTTSCFNEGIVLNTRFHRIEVRKDATNDVSLRNSRDQAEIIVPHGMNIRSEKIQQKIRYFIIEVLRSEAKSYLIPRVEEMAKKHGFSYQRVYIKNMKTRWGSCSAVNNINLNLHLMRLPAELADYVILHELTHTKHKNHGPEFWNALSAVSGGKTKILRKDLRKYNTRF